MEKESKQKEGFQDETGGSKTYQKRRLYVREITSFTYSLAKELKRLRSIPRVTKGKDLKFKSGARKWTVNILTPKHDTTQALYGAMVIMGPGGRSVKHGHMNEAVFYILDGKGHEIHDGKRYDWEAGDLVVVENACVHQHFNDDPNNFARALVIKSKPLYLFMNLFFQELLEGSPTEPYPGWENFKPNVT